MNSNLIYIKTSDDLYSQAKQIRIACFFEGMDKAEELINDKFEANGIHIVYLDEKLQVIGTGRIHTEGSTSVLSQMAIKNEHQRNGIGLKILHELIQKCESLGLEKIELSARVTALEFYSKVGFKAIGNKYPSPKTGIIHQKISMAIN